MIEKGDKGMEDVLKIITIDNIMKFNPCYEREEIESFFIESGFIDLRATPLEIAQSDYSNKEDILWLLLRPEIIPKKTLHILSYEFALTALKNERLNGREPDERSWRAVEAKRTWVKGLITDERLSAAESVARAATWSAEESAAWSAAWSARSAARAAARSAAESAAWSVARTAEESAAESVAESVARAATWSAEESAQIELVIKYLVA